MHKINFAVILTSVAMLAGVIAAFTKLSVDVDYLKVGQSRMEVQLTDISHKLDAHIGIK
jgi:hypothetical protein